MTLEIRHKIRSDNIVLYSELFNQEAITLVAESSYGAVIGFAEIDIEMFSKKDRK